MRAVAAWILAVSAACLATASGSVPRASTRAPHPASPGRALDVQVLLDRAGFSPGEIDGRTGRNTALALAAYQRAHGTRVSGRADGRTLRALRDADPYDVLAEYALAAEDVAGPWRPIPDDPAEQAKLQSLDFVSPIERLGERFHASPALLMALNPSATFATVGEVLRVPNVASSVQPSNPASVGGPQPVAGSVRVTVSKHAGSLTVEAGDRVVFHAPVTVGSEHDPLPIGEWTVTVVQPNPVFFYNPELFWDADPSHAKARLPPGPNNPAGVVWIGISHAHYGLHGTPEPGAIGRAASHGCVRLTNWDATRVATLVTEGTPVVFEE